MERILNIKIRRGKPNRGDKSTPRKLDENDWEIVLHKSIDGKERAFSVHSDLCRIVAIDYLGFQDEDTLAKFVRDIEKAFKNAYDKHWRGCA